MSLWAKMRFFREICRKMQKNMDCTKKIQSVIAGSVSQLAIFWIVFKKIQFRIIFFEFYSIHELPRRMQAHLLLRLEDTRSCSKKH